MRIGEDSTSSSDTGSPVTQSSITGLGSVSISPDTTPLAIGAGMGIGEAYFSSGNSIHVGDSGGRGLLAHEVTHVVQQTQGRVKPT